MLGNQAIQTRTINAYTPLYPDSDITFVLKTQPVKYRVPDTYTLSTGNSGHGSVDLPCPPEGIWKWEVIDSEGVVKRGDLAYSPAALSLFDWLAFGASDSLMAANNLDDIVSAAQAQINLSLLPGTDIPAFTDIPDALTDLDTAVTGSELNSIKTDVDALSSDYVANSGATMTGALFFSGTSNPGLFPNRLTTAQRDAIGAVSAGGIIWNTTATQLEVYNGSAWVAV